MPQNQTHRDGGPISRRLARRLRIDTPRAGRASVARPGVSPCLFCLVDPLQTVLLQVGISSLQSVRQTFTLQSEPADFTFRVLPTSCQGIRSDATPGKQRAGAESAIAAIAATVLDLTPSISNQERPGSFLQPVPASPDKGQEV